MLSPTELIKRHTSLSANIVAFCRFLRTKDFKIAPPEEADALQTIEILQPFYASDLMRDALKVILTRSQDQAARFDELYDYYWKQVKHATDSKVTEQAAEKPKPKPPSSKPDAQFQSLKDWLYGTQENEEELDLYTYSAAESLTKKDFSTMTDDELKEVYELIKMIARRLARQRNRRFKKNKNGDLDLRKTLRQNMRRGGEMLEIVRKKKQKRRVKLVLLCDVSKSMELYSRFIIQFSYSFNQVFKQIETFVFSTKLAKISEILMAHPDKIGRGGNFDDILKNLSENVPNWSGGTRIGESFMDFIDNYGEKCLTSRTIVFIISDGWDTGNLEALETAMKTFYKKTDKVIWLNPLASNPSYEATTAGMKLALPYIDVFAAGHNVESLRKVIGRF